MWLGPLFRGTFEVQAGNRPLQGQSKPPVFTGGFDYEKIKGQIEGDFNGENPELLYSMKFDKIRARM